jgi:hypothetical protein
MAIAPNTEFTIVKQEFLNSVINKIGKQTYADQAYLNPLKRFKGEFIENASDIEEIYVSKAEDTGYDKEGANVLDRAKPVVYARYHSNEIEHGYKVTVHDKQMRKGFSSKGALSTMGDHIVQSMHTGSNIDEYNDIIEVLKALASAKTVNNTITIAPVTDESSAKRFCKEVKKIIPKMGEWNSLYSAKPNYAPKEKLVLFLDSDVDVEVQTEYLASLFNMTIAQLNDTTKVVIPNLITKLGNDQFAVLCDERCLKINPTYYNVESIRNTRGKFTNYDLVTNLLASYTDWFQFIVFVGDATP